MLLLHGGPCTWYGMEHCIVTVSFNGFLPSERMWAAVMHYAAVTLTTDTDRVPTEKVDALFLNRALGNYLDYCSMRKPHLYPFINLASRHEKSPTLSS